MLLLWIILFSLLGSVGAIGAAAFFLTFQDEKQKALIPCLISYASGTLLTAALLGLIPHALEYALAFQVLSTVLIGIILFFLLEKLLIWRHCHDPECNTHGVVGPILLIGDAFHNLIDGVVIAAGFLSSVPIGITMSLSIIAHEIPQEVGDLAILLHSGYSKKKALLLNILSSLSTIPGAIIAYYALGSLQTAIPYAMAISAASFLYISLADLTPELHSHLNLKSTIQQFILILAGAGTIILLLQLHP